MAYRVSPTDVMEIIPVDPDYNVTRHIRSANTLLNAIMAKCSGLAALDATTLAEIELYLAGHYYQKLDPQYRQQTIGNASGTYQGQSGKFLEGTDHGQAAIELDVSGCLAKWQAQMMNGAGRGASVGWGGKTDTESVDYEDRN